MGAQPSPQTTITPPVKAKLLSIALLLALVALYIVNNLLADKFFWTLLLIPCLSLLMFLPGIIKNQPRAYDWLCFVLLIHFTMGVSNAMSPRGAWDDYLQVALAVGLFISAMMTSRWQKAFVHAQQA